MLDKFKNSVVRNKKKVLVYTVFIVLFTLLFVVSRSFITLKFFLLIPISILGGIGFVSFFKSVLPIKNIITFLVLSFLLGIFLNTMIIFGLGSLGLDIGLSFYSIYLPVIGLLNAFLYFFMLKEEDVENYLNRIKPHVIDYIWFGVLAVFVFVFFSIAMENYFLGWDGFSFWAIDAKYIFQNGALRDESFDILMGSYLSFYPLQLSYVYFLFGEIVEQHASMLTLLYGISGVLLIYSYVINIKRNVLVKSLLYSSAIISLYTWFTIHNVIFTLYADVFCCTMALLYGVVLFNNFKNDDTKSYWKRCALLFLIAISFYLTKLGYSMISIFLLGFYFLYDIKFIYKNILRKPNVILIGAVTILLLALGYFFFQNFLSGDSIVSYTFQSVLGDLKSRVSYFISMLEFLIAEVPLLIIYTLFLLLLSFFLKRKFTKLDLKRILFVFLLLFIPFTFFMIKMETFADYSILRYFGIVYFVFPYLFVKLSPKTEIKDSVQEYIAVAFTVLLPLCLGLLIGLRWQVDFNIEPQSGSYKDPEPLHQYYLLAEEVKEIVPENARILFVDKEFESLGNSRVPSMYLRYFLSEYSVGKQYLTGMDTWYGFMKEVNPDYVLVLEYDGYWESCNDILEEGVTQLVTIESGHAEYSDTQCFFTLEDIIKL